jgi:small-conductance mechanosensitive channel
MINTEIMTYIENNSFALLVVKDITILLTTYFLYKIVNFAISRIEKQKETLYKISKLIFIWIVLAVIIRDSLIQYGINNEATIFKVLSVTFTILVGIVSYQILSYLIDVQIKSKSLINSGSKNSLKILLKLIIIITTFIISIDVTGLKDLFGETTVFGVTGIILGLTASIWFPDIFAGLILVFNRYINEGDVIEIEDKKIFGVVHKIGLFSTVIRNIVNNHMVVIKNSYLRDVIINNLSKKAGSAGLRETLNFNIGYETNKEPTDIRKVYKMFEEAIKTANISMSNQINFEKGIEYRLANPGDFALEFKVFYYIKEEAVKNKLTVEFKMYEIFYNQSIESEIGLSTPTLSEITIKR